MTAVTGNTGYHVVVVGELLRAVNGGHRIPVIVRALVPASVLSCARSSRVMPG